MKKDAKKLHLSRETLRNLKEVRAAGDPEPTGVLCVGSTLSGQLCCGTTDSALCQA